MRFPMGLLSTGAHAAPGCAGNASIPGNLLRFDATVKLSSQVNRTRFAQDAVKGIVMNEAVNRSAFQPIPISGMPYTANSPVRACSWRRIFDNTWRLMVTFWRGPGIGQIAQGCQCP